MRRSLALLSSLLACLSIAVSPPSAAAQKAPSPESVLGHRPGDDFYLANYDESRDYFRKLAASSDRILPERIVVFALMEIGPMSSVYMMKSYLVFGTNATSACM